MKKKLPKMIESFKKTFWIYLVFLLIIGIFVLPAFVYASFNIKYYKLNFFRLFELVQDGFSGSFAKLSLIFKNKAVIDGSKYIFNYYKNFILIFTAIYMYLMYKSVNLKGEFEDIEHGSSDWANEKEIRKMFSEKDGLILAEKIALPVGNDAKGNINVLVVGNTGSGKSSGFVLPNIKQNLGSYIFTDPKGEIFDYSAEYFRNNGYDIKVLNLKNPRNSDGYNPLLNIESDTDLDVVVHTILMGQGDMPTSDPYFVDNAKILFKAIIRFLLETRPDIEKNLSSCSNLVRLASGSGQQNELAKLMRILPEEHLARKDYNSVALTSDKAFASICSTLQSVIAKFDSPEIASLTATNTIDFEEIGKRKTALYVISPDTHSTFDFLLTIFFSQLIQKLYNYADSNGGKLDVPVMFFLDEFANIGKIPDFDRKVATARSRGISFNIILQSLEQLEAIYGEASETIIGNCGTHLFLGSTSSKTLEHFSKSLGVKTIMEKIKSKDEEKGDKQQKIGRELMTPDEVRRLPYEECLILALQGKPIKGKKYFHYQHKESIIPEKYYTDHNKYYVDRGEWRAFSLQRYRTVSKEAEVEDIFKKAKDETNVQGVQKNDNTKKQDEREDVLKKLFYDVEDKDEIIEDKSQKQEKENSSEDAFKNEEMAKRKKEAENMIKNALGKTENKEGVSFKESNKKTLSDALKKITNKEDVNDEKKLDSEKEKKQTRKNNSDETLLGSDTYYEGTEITEYGEVRLRKIKLDKLKELSNSQDLEQQLEDAFDRLFGEIEKDINEKEI